MKQPLPRAAGILLLLTCCCLPSLARKPLVLHSEPDSIILLAGYTEVYVDSVPPQALERVQAAWESGHFVPLENLFYPNKFASRKYHYWFRIELDNQSPDTLDLRLQVPRMDSVFYYQFSDGQLVRSTVFGNLMSLEAIREFDLETFSMSTLPVELLPGRRYTIWLRAMDRLYLTDKFRLRLMTPDQFFQRDNESALRSVTIESFFLGILFFVMFFSLFQFFQNRDRAFLFYSLYVALLFLYFWQRFDFANPLVKIIHPLTPEWRYIKIPVDIGIYMAYALFVQYFVDEHRRYKGLRQFIRWALLGLVVYLVFTIVLSAFSLSWSWIIHYYMRLGLVGIMVGMIVKLLRIETPLSKYIIAGTGLLLVFSLLIPILLSWRTMGIYWKSLDVAVLISRSGILMELLCFSLGLGYKSRIAREAKILAEQEVERVKEVEQLKDRLYTNITHEFRTPLTVILGLAKQLQGQVQEKSSASLDMIQRNGRQLLRLVNQMLDLSKLEAGKIRLNPVNGDVVVFLKYLTESFHSLAESRAIQLHFLSDLETIYMDYDPERLQQIFVNLLSNAIKFTSEGGNIYLQVSKLNSGRFELKIRDTGLGIPEEELPYIFDRFYQVPYSVLVPPKSGESYAGAGVGLALVKELVLLMEGTIRVKSKPGKGAEFILTLPVSNEASPAATSENAFPSSSPSPKAMPAFFSPDSPGAPKVLVVEDNQDVLQYISNCLTPNFRIEAALNGEEGIEKARKEIPDLIISDIMMPIKDGLEVCRAIKTDRRTSHIPVVLLTAKAGQQSKLKGLELGADVYLTKPFDEEELLLHLNNLLQHRERLKSHYQFLSGLSEHGQATEQEPAENSFIVRVKTVIQEHLGDSSFTVSQLSKEVAMSSSQLHRKLKAVVGYSASKMIRLIRLAYARRLLQNPELSIASVAYDCGFSDPDYFSKVFKKECGLSPSEFRNEMQG